MNLRGKSLRQCRTCFQPFAAKGWESGNPSNETECPDCAAKDRLAALWAQLNNPQRR